MLLSSSGFRGWRSPAGEDEGKPRLPGSSRRPCSEPQERSISLGTYGSRSPLHAASPRPLQLRGRAICAFWEGNSPAEGRLLEPWAQYLLGPGPAVRICKAALWVLGTAFVMPLHPSSAGGDEE